MPNDRVKNWLVALAAILVIILAVLGVIWLSADVAYSRGWNEAMFRCDMASMEGRPQ